MTSEKERVALCRAFLMTGNATAAFVEVYGEGIRALAHRDAQHFFTTQLTRRVLEKMRDKLAQRVNYSLEQLAQANIAIARFDPSACFDESGALIPLAEMPPEARQCIASIDVEERGENTRVHKIKFVARDGALDRLARMMGAYAKDNAQRNAGAQAAQFTRAQAAAELDVPDDIELARRIVWKLTLAQRRLEEKDMGPVEPASEQSR